MKSSSSLKVYVDDRIFGFSSTASTSSNQKNKNNIITKNDNISPENSPKRSGKALKISDGEGYTKNRADSSSSKDMNAPVLIQVDSSILEKEKESGSSVHIVLQPLSQLSPSKTEQKSDVKSSSSRSSKTPPENNPKNSSSSRIQERAINLGSGKGDDSSHHSHDQSHKSDTSSKKQSLYSSRSSSSSKSSSKKETNKKPISKDYTYSYEEPTPEEKAKFAQINQQNLSPQSSPRNYSISKIPQVEIKPENKESAVQTPRRFAGRKSPNKGSRNTSPRRASPRKSSPRKDLSPQHLSPRKKKVLERIELLELQLADLQSTPVDSENIVSDILVDKHKTKQIKENPQANLVSEHVQTTNLGFMKPADAILTIQTPIIEEEPQIPTPPASPLSISNAVQMNLVRSQTTSIAPSEYDSDESYEYESDNSELADRRKHPQLKVDVPKQTRVKKHIRVPKESPKQTTKAQPRVQERARSPSPKKGESKAPEDKIYRKVRIEKPKKTNSPRQELNQNEQQFIVQERDIQIMSSSVTMNDSSIGELNPVRAKAYAQKHFKKYEDPEYAKAHGVPFKPAQNYQSRQSPKQSPKKQKESDKKKKDNDSCTLKVNIREATNIPTVPTYCVLFVDGNAANPIKTEVAEAANSRKVFDEEYSLKVKDLRKANLIVLVKKEDLIRGDKLLGSTKIRISDLPLNNSLDKWYPLTTDTGVHTEGRLHLVLKKSQKGFVSSSNSSISSVTTSTAEFNEMINKLSSHTTSDFVPTTTITSSPQESVSKSSSQTASSSSNSPPTNTKSEWESYDSQPKQESTKSKPESTKSKPESTKSKPESTKSKSKSTKLKPEYAKDSVKEKSKSISSKNSETKFAQQESTISSVADTSKSHLTKTSSVSTPSKKNITVQKSPRSESSSRTPQQSKGARSSVSGSSKSSPKGTMNSTKESLFDVSLFKENPNPGRQSSVVPDESENSLKLLSESSSSESELEVQERDIPIIEKETKKFSNQDKSKENKKVIKPQQPVKDQKDSKEVKKPSKDKKKITNDENKPTKEDKKSNRKEKKPIKIKKKSIKEEKKPTKEEKKSIKEEKKQEIEEREVLKLEKKSLNDIKPVKEITKDNEDIKSASEETKSPKEEKERVEDVQSSQIEQSKQEEKKPDQGNKLKTITPSKVEQKQLNKATVHPEKRPMKVVVNKPVKEQNIPLKPEKESSSSAQNEVAEKLQEKPEELNQQIHEEVPEEKVQSDHAVPREVEINSINVNDIREIPENSELSESTATVTSDFPLSDSSSSSSSSDDDENKENKESALSKLLGLNSPREPNYRRPKAQITYHEEPQEYSSSDGYDASAPSLTPTNFPIPTIKRPEDNSQLSIQQLLQRQKINSSYKTIEEELSESSTDSENIEIDNVPIEMISDNEDDIARRIDMRFGKQVDTGNVDYNQGDNIMFNLGNVVQLIPERPKKKKSNKYYGSLDFDDSDDVQEREIALDLTRSKITKVNAKTKEPHGIVGDLGIMVSKKKAEARNDPNRLSASSSSIFPSNSAALSANTVPLSSEQSSGSGGLNERYIQAGDKLSDENEFYSGNLADNISGAGKRYTDIIKRSIVDAEIENNFSSNDDIHRKQKADLNRNMKFNDGNHAFNSNKPNDYLEREIELSEENSPSNEQSDASISDIEKKKGISKVIQKALKEDDNSNVFSSAVENQKPIRIKKIEATKEKFSSSSSSSSSSSEGEKVKGDSSSISNAVVKSIKKKIKFDDDSNNFDSTSSFAEKPNKNQTKKPEQKTKTYNPEKQKTSKVQKGEKADFERDYDYNLSDSSSSAVENDKAPKTKQPVNDDTSSSSSSSKENEFVSDVNKPTRSITHSIKDDDNSNNFASELSEPKKLQPASKKSESKKTVSSSSSSSDQEETNPSVITREIRITPINEEISSSSISDIPQEKKIQRKIVKKIKSDDESNNFSSVIEGEPAIISVQRGPPPRQQHVSSSSSSSSGIYTLKPQIVTRPDPTQVKPKYNISSDSSTSISDLNEEKKIQKTIVKKIHIDDESNDFESLLESNPIQPAVKKVPKKQVVASSSSSSSSDSQTDTISEAQKEKMKKKIGEKIHVYDVSNSFTSTASEPLKKSSSSSDSENFNKGEEEPVTRSIKKLIPVSSSSSDESNLSDSSSRNKSKIKPVENGEIASEKSSSEKKIYKKPDQNELSESSSTTSSSHSKSVSTSISSVVKEEEGLENNILHCIINDENENSFTSTSRNENLFEYSLQKVSSDSSSSSSSSDEPKILMKKLPPVENSSESLKESEGRKSHHAKSSEVKEFFISDEEKSISSKKSNKSEPKKIISTPSSSSSSEDENRSINSTKSNKSHKSIDQEKGVYLGNSSLSSVVQPELEEQIEQCFKNDDLENSFTSIIDSKPPVQNREIFVKPLEETSSNEEKAKSSSSTQSSKSKSSRKPEPKLPESYTSSSEEEIDKKSASSRKSNKSANSQKSNKSKNTVKSETKVESSSSSEDDKKSVDSHKSNKSTSSHKSIYSKKSNQSDISNHSNKSRSSQFSDLKDEPANFPRSIEPQLGQDNQGRYVRDYDHNELLPSYSSTVSRSSSLSNPKLSESSSFDKYHKSISSKKSNPVEDRGVDIESSQVSELKSENTNLSKIAEPRLEEDIKETIARDLDNKEFMSSSSSSISRHSKCSKKSNKSNSHRKEGSPVSESKSDSTVLSRVTEPKLDEDIKESIAQDLDNNNFLSASSTSSSSSSASKKSAKSKSSSKSIPKQPISSSSSSSSSEKKSISSKKSNKSNQKTVQSSSSNDEKQKKAIQRDALLSSSDEKSSKSSSRLSEAKSPSTNISQYAKEEEPELDQQITSSIVKDFVPNDFSSSSSFSKKSETHSSSTSSSSDNLLPPRRSSEHKVEQPTQNGKQETVKQQKKLFSDNLSPPPPRRNTKKEAEIPKAKEQAQQISSSSYSSSDYEKSSRTSTSTRLIGKPPLPSKLLISSKNIPLPRYDDSSSSSSSVSMTSISEIVKDESELEGNIEACLAVDEVVNDFSSVSFTSENLEPAKKRDIEIQEYEEEEEVPNIESSSSSSSIREKLFRNKKMKQNQHSLSSDAKSSSTVTSSSPTSKASSELEHKIDDVLVHDNGEHIFSSAASLKESSHISYTYTYEVEEEDIIEFERVTSESSEPISTRSKKSNKSNKSEMSKKSNRLEKKYSSSDSDSIPSRKSTKSEKSAKSNKKLVEFSSSEPESRKSAKESSKSKKSISYSIPPQKVSKRSIKLESESSSLSSSSKNNMINELSSISDAAKISSEIEQKLLLDDNENVFTSEIKESEKSETTSRFSSGFDSASESLGVPRRHSKSSSKVSTLSDDDSFSHSQSSKYSCGKNNEFSYDLDEENETAFLETPKHGSKELIRNETLESDSLDIPSPKKSNKQTPSSSTNLESSKSEKKTKKFTSDDNDKNMRLKLHSTSTSKSSSENDKVQQLSDIEPANIENRNVSNFDLSVSDSESLSEQYPNIKKSKNKIDSSSSQKKPSSDTQHKKQTDNKKNNHNQQKMTTSSSSSSTSVSSISGAKSLSSLNENGQKLLLNESSTSISSSYYDISSSSSLSQLLSPASIESPWKVTLTIGQCTNFKNYNSLTVLVKMRDANPHFHRGKVGKNKEMRFVISNSKAPFKVVLYDGKYEVASFDSQIDEVIMRQDHEEVLTMTPNGGVPSTPLLSLKIHVIHS